jgi:acid phosphatase
MAALTIEMWRFRFFAVTLSALMGAQAAGAQEANPFARIDHIVVIYTENRSFDHVFGLFPGAEGIAEAGGNPQIDRDGKPLPHLPFPFDRSGALTRPNAPFMLEGPLAGVEPVDPTHDFYPEQEQINGGLMNRFVEASNAGGFVMGHRDGRRLRQWALAAEFTLADHFFHGAFGGSFINHVFLICGCPPTYPDAPERLVALLDENGRLQRDEKSPGSALDGPPRWRRSGKVTPDGYAFGKFEPFAPIGPSIPGKAPDILPAQTAATIGERLDEKGISWAWYAGGWAEVMAGRSAPYVGPERFQTHHQPFLYFQAYGPGSAARAAHLKDAREFLEAAEKGTLPQVSFYKPPGRLNAHPVYSDFEASDAHVGEIVDRLRASPNWPRMMIVVTADENGGFFDHLDPPAGDRFGPGARVPTLVISPFARRGFVDKTVYETASILRTIEARFDLAPLTSRDRTAADLRNALEPPR